MGLCASTTVEEETKHRSKQNSLKRSTTVDARNVTESAVANILKHRRRQVVHDGQKRVEYKRGSAFDFPLFEKSGEKKRFLTNVLKSQFFMFSEISDDMQEKMIDSLEEDTNICLRDYLMKAGEEGDYMYVVETGEFEVTIDGVKVKSIKPGMIVGELALLYQAPRAADVRCVKEPAKLWKLKREVFVQIQSFGQQEEAQSNIEKLSKVDMLKDLSPSQLNSIADCLVSVHFKKGTKIINQGDDGEAFYMIDTGSVACIDRMGKSADLILNAGQYFGEIALMRNEKRKRDVVCREDTTCLILDRKDFNSLLGNLKTVMDRNLGMRVLASVDIFKTLAPNVKDMIVGAFQEREYKLGDTVIKINEPGDSFFVVREGSAKVLGKDNNKIGMLKEGDFFGEGSLLSGKPRGATIIVESVPFRAFELKKNDFDRLLGPIKAVLKRTNAERKKLMEMQNVKLDEVLANCKRPLGQGTFGLVKLVTLKKQAFALKVLQKKQIVSYNLVKNILYEKRMMVESDHPFVLKLVNTYSDKNCLYMLLEIVSGGELFAFLQTRGGSVSTRHSTFITACVVSVFEYIHSKNICYRDLKPENLMIDAEGYIKMVDFGFAKVVTDKTYTLCGTPEYMAPEILLRRGHNKGVDYWATGILIYECESGQTPFADYES
eukprot:g15770.t1